MQQASKNLGIKVSDPMMIGMKSNKKDDWVSELEDAIKESKEKPQIVVSLVYNKSSPIYEAVKKFLVKHVGIAH